MPSLQVLQREDTSRDNRFSGVSDAVLETIKMKKDALYKAQILKYYADELKSKMAMSKDEIEKAKIQGRYENAKTAAAVMDDAYKTAEKFGGKAAQDKLVMYQKMYPDVFPALMEDGFSSKLSQLEPSGEEKLKGVAADYLKKQLGQGQDSGSPVDNANRAGAVGGAVIPSMNIGGIQMDFPGVQAQQEASKVAAQESGRALSGDAANAVAFEEESGPVFENLYKNIDKLPKGKKGSGGSMGWFGGAKINAGTEAGPGQAMLRMQENSQQRALAMDLNKIKQIAFTYGGKTLSETERNLVFSALSPVNKSPEQWKKDLQWAQRRMKRAAELQSNPRGQVLGKPGLTVGRFKVEKVE